MQQPRAERRARTGGRDLAFRHHASLPAARTAPTERQSVNIWAALARVS